MRKVLWKPICISRFSEFLILESILLHSITVKEGKEFLKQSCLTLERGTLFLCLAIYSCLIVGITSKRYLGDFLLFWKRGKTSCTIVIAVRIQSLVLDISKFFSWAAFYSSSYWKCFIILNWFKPLMKRIIKRLVI